MPDSRALLAVIAVAALALPAPPAGALPAAPGTEDAFSLVREEQTVTAALKHPQPLSETPSSVTVITAAEIRANGYHTLGEALRWVRGLFVTYDRNYYYLGVRGLQRPGDYNNKVLLTLDGHALNGNVYGDAYFGPDLGIDMESVERIEIVRGPGSALYGSYAALAVVNVVTRHPRSEKGPSVAARAGGAGERRGFASLAAAQSGRPEWSAAVSWLDAQGADLYFPEFDSPLTGSGRAIDVDGERAVALLGNAEWADLHLAAKFSERRKTVPTASFGTRFGDPRNETYDGHDFVEMSLTSRPDPDMELFGRGYWDGSRYHATYVYGDSAPVLNLDRGDGDVLGSEWRANWSGGTHSTITLGLEGQLHVRAQLKNFDQNPYVTYFDQSPTRRLGALYVQDESHWAHGIRLTGGARLDGSTGNDPVISPRLDLVWQLAAGTTFKLLAGSAFRTPSPYESDYFDGNTEVRSAGLLPERVGTTEAALEQRLGPCTMSLSAYASRVRDLIDLVNVDSLGHVQFRNRAHAVSRGLEGEVQYVGAGGDRLRLAAALQDTDDPDLNVELSNSPHWDAHLVLTHAPVNQPLSFGCGLRYLSPRLTLGGSWNAAELVADARVARRMGRGIEIGVEAKNLFDARYTDPGSGEHIENELLQDPRALYLTLSLRPTAAP